MDWSWLTDSAAVAWKNGGQGLFGGLIAVAWQQRSARNKSKNMRRHLYKDIGFVYSVLHEVTEDNNELVLMALSNKQYLTLPMPYYDHAIKDMDTFHDLPEHGLITLSTSGAKHLSSKPDLLLSIRRSRLVGGLRTTSRQSVIDKKLFMQHLLPEMRPKFETALVERRVQLKELAEMKSPPQSSEEPM